MAPWWLRTQSDEKLEDEFLQDEPHQDGSPQDESPQEEPAQDGSPRDASDLSSQDRAVEPAEGAGAEGDPEAKDTSEAAAAPEADASSEPRRRRRRRRRRKSAASSDVSADGESPVETAPEPTEVQKPSRPQTTETPAPVAPPAPQVVATPAVRPPAGSPFEHNFVVSFPERSSPADERKLALFCDFENIALGVRSSEVKKLDMDLILARLLEKGKIIVKRAYADWERYNEYKRVLHESAIELIDIPQKYYSGKNSADIKMVVDAMDLCYSKEHLDTFVILSGDSDFSPLVSKLKENDKLVIGVGMKDSSSKLLVDNCDEFVYYEDIWRSAQTRPKLDDLPPQKAEVFGLMADAMLALLRENKEILWGSLVKQTMQRKRPSFNEAYYGYSSFSQLLEDAEKHHVIGLRKDERSGNYVVTGFVNS